MIELSFARLGHPFRAMYARVMMSSDGAWRYFGYLTTADADGVGTLITAPEDRVELLAGVNTDPAADRYAASGLSPGRYLICAPLAEADNHSDVCGELSVD